VRLTLRTLLAYLDDTLEPAQAKLIGQKVAESDTAQELIARIKEVTRQRRLAAPAAIGGRLEATVIAGYLDNTLPAEQLAEVEQICLESDVHLAEMAACHQILTLVLGEPALVPPTAKQRMYGLVKGPEAIPFRKPAAAPAEREDIVQEHKETDETLRLGLPALRARGSWTNRLILLGGGLTVAALLAIAIIQILQYDRVSVERPRAGGGLLAKAESETKVERPTPTEQITKPATTPSATHKTKATRKETETPDPVEPNKNPKVGIRVAAQDVAWAPPSNVPSVAGHYEPNKTPDPGMLLQYDPEKSLWQRLDVKKPEVRTGRPLVSLPGYKSAVALKNGVRLLLWGNVPELWPAPPVLESLVELHHHDQLDADLTLRRGRIVLANTHADRPARVRVRFDNPTNPKLGVTWDLTLEDANSEVALERWGLFPPGETFYKNPQDKMRLGPRADVALIVLKGRLRLKSDNQTDSLEAPPKRALMLWNSHGNITGPSKFPTIPEWSQTPLPFPKGAEEALKRPRADFYRARDNLSSALTGKADKVEVALANALKSMDPVEQVLVVRCFGAIDDLESLLVAASDSDDAHREVRQYAIVTLRNWISYGRDNDYRLYDALKDKYKIGEAENIMSLLHGFSNQELGKKETYETLIDYLTNPNGLIRDLSLMNLYQLVPAGRGIPYSPYADSRDRERAQREWTKLLESGQIPPRAMKK